VSRVTFHLLLQAAASLGLFVGGLGMPMAIAYLVYDHWVLGLPVLMLMLPPLCARLVSAGHARIALSWSGWLTQWLLLGVSVALEMADLFRW
jgi:hypothetical protein